MILQWGRSISFILLCLVSCFVMASREITYLCHLFAMRILTGRLPRRKDLEIPAFFQSDRTNFSSTDNSVVYLNSRKPTGRCTILQTSLIFPPPMGRVEFSYCGGSDIMEMEIWIGGDMNSDFSGTTSAVCHMELSVKTASTEQIEIIVEKLIHAIDSF